MHGGFGTGIDLFLPPPIIAATYTIIFTGPTDIDNDGNPDAAFREIYYTFNFPWGINTNSPIDVETVALHETGHGLSQGHFGKAFVTNSNGKLHFAPLAVMNAGYTGVQQSLAGTDNGGHCSMWGKLAEQLVDGNLSATRNGAVNRPEGWASRPTPPFLVIGPLVKPRTRAQPNPHHRP